MALAGLAEREKDSFTTIGSENSRDVLYFGESSYRYSGGEHAAKPLPDEKKILQQVFVLSFQTLKCQSTHAL